GTKKNQNFWEMDSKCILISIPENFLLRGFLSIMIYTLLATNIIKEHSIENKLPYGNVYAYTLYYADKLTQTQRGLKISSRHSTFSFYTTDEAGIYTIIVESISEKGEMVREVRELKVKEEKE